MADYPSPSQTKLPIFNTANFLPQEIATTNTEDDVINKRLYQDLTYSIDDGYYGLAKDAFPLPDPASSGKVAVSTWTQRELPINNSFNGVCWSPQLAIFVACCSIGASANRIITSPDGLTWTTRTAGGNLNAIVWSPELSLFVVVGEGTIQSSPNGNTWTTRETNPALWKSVIWIAEKNIFVAVSNNVSAVSSNGTSWTISSAFGTTIALNDVCWSPELNLIVAVGNYISGTTNRLVYTSTNGLNWTTRITPNNNNYNGVCWSRELGIFVAIANTGSGNRIMTSNNGINWISVSSSDDNYSKIIWCKELGLFVATTSTSLKIFYSSNGTSWSQVGITRIITGLCWNAEYGIIIGVSPTITGGTSYAITSSFKGRPPTLYIFDSPYNTISENGLWTLSGLYVKSILTGQSATPSFKITPISTNTTNSMFYLENATGGAYNSAVNAGDNALIFDCLTTGQTTNIGTRYAGYCGLTMGDYLNQSTPDIIIQMGQHFYWETRNNRHIFITGNTGTPPAQKGVELQPGDTSWRQVSDGRLKKEVSDIQQHSIYDLRPVEYRILDDDETAQKRAGLIAQEVLPHLPLVVSQAEDGYYGIKYTELIPYLIQSIKELTAEIVALELLLPQ